MRYRRKIISIISAAALLAASVFTTPLSVYAADGLILDDSYEESLSTPNIDGDALYEISYEGELPYGLAGMGEGYKASSNDLFLKEEIVNHNMIEELDDYTPGYDYVADEVIFAADDEDYALRVAKAYNASLVSCHDGVAVIELDSDLITVPQAVALSSEPEYPLPAVFPNYITRLSDPVPTKVISTDSLSHAASANLPGFNWEFWYEDFNDPALNPGYIFYDPYHDEDWNGYQWMHDAVGSYEAWGMNYTPETVTVAVLDTGVYEGHEDLAGKVTTHHLDVTGGRTEVDYSGHGTHVAGIIAAAGNNGKGGTGIAYMDNVQILNVPVFSDGEEGHGAYDAEIAAGINYVANKGGTRRADIINMSLGGPEYNPLVQQAVNNAYEQGVTICAAMGNDNSNNIYYPAAYDHVIAVASVDATLTRSSFSTYGAWADISAPGSAIFSTWNGHDYNEVEKTGNKNDDYNYYSVWDGTSMACPVVAGTCALYMDIYGYTSPDDMEAALKNNAAKIKDSGMGAGIVNIASMIPNDDIAPVITAQDNANETGTANKVSLSELTPDSYIVFREDQNSNSGAGYYVYTLDGSKPVYKDGEVTNGYSVPAIIINDASGAAVKVQDLIDTGYVISGQPVTLTVGRVNVHGKFSKLAAETITVSYPASTVPSSITICGPLGIAKGKSGLYTLDVLPAYINAGSVAWTATGSGVTVNPKTGKVSVAKNSTDSSFELAATLDSVSTTVSVDIVEPATGINLKPEGLNNDVNKPKINNKGICTEVRMYTTDIPDTDFTENKLQLTGEAIGNSLAPVFASSKPSIASVDNNGLITAHRPGKTKITCKASDGSGKTASINVQVIVPASRLTIISKLHTATVAYGKTASLTAVPENTYGKPAISKVNWSIESVQARQLSDSGSINLGNLSAEDIAKYIKIKNGKVSVNKKLSSVTVEGTVPDFFAITAAAETTDGTCIKATKKVFATAPATVCYVTNKTGKDKITKDTIDEKGSYYCYVKCDQKLVNPECSSSNPNVVSVKSIDIYQGLHRYYLSVNNSGTATLTFKTTDGTNKKATVKITVK